MYIYNCAIPAFHATRDNVLFAAACSQKKGTRGRRKQIIQNENFRPRELHVLLETRRTESWEMWGAFFLATHVAPRGGGEKKRERENGKMKGEMLFSNSPPHFVLFTF